MKILVTGTAGFVGFHLVARLVSKGHDIIGVDNINDYYNPELKYARLKKTGIDRELIEWNKPVDSQIYPNYKFIRMTIEDKAALNELCQRELFDVVINLAAQAGVRYSIENPDVYIQSNVVGFLNILEVCRHFKVKHLIYASSSSVYGLNETMPFSVSNSVNHPVSLYAASKKANELMAHTYSHLYNIPTTGLRFFTVYGPWGRPDMAYYLFANAIRNGKEIKIFNHGKMMRDFTYIDDIIDGIECVIANPASPDSNWDAKAPNPSTSTAPYRVFNLGNNQPVQLMEMITAIEDSMGEEAQKVMMEMQDGDVQATWADIDALAAYGYQPKTSITDGIQKFIEWYKESAF